MHACSTVFIKGRGGGGGGTGIKQELNLSKGRLKKELEPSDRWSERRKVNKELQNVKARRTNESDR